MKKFLMHLGVILVVTYIVFYGLDTIITRNLHHSDAMMFRRWNDIIFDTTYHDVLICGNSRAWHFYDPYIIDSICCTNSYNLGLDGRYISSQVARCNLYLQYHRKPRCVVQSVEHFTLSSSADNKFEREQFLPYFFNNFLYDDIYKDEGFDFADKCIPFVRYIGYKDVIFEGLTLPNDLVRSGNYYKGFQAERREWNNTEYTIDSLEFSCDANSAAIFENFVSRLVLDGISVVLVLGPIYRGSRTSVVIGDEEQRMYDWFNACAEKYGCPVLNYMQLDMCFNTNYFYNATHVNAEGSRVISERLAKDLDSILNKNTYNK